MYSPTPSHALSITRLPVLDDGNTGDNKMLNKVAKCVMFTWYFLTEGDFMVQEKKKRIRTLT